MINGKNLVAGNWESQSDSIKFQTINPKTQEALAIDFQQATSDQISRALEAASESFELVAALRLTDRIRFLECIQKEMQLIQSEIIATYQMESALAEGRANGEFQRTMDQIQRFIELLQKGNFVKASLHTGGPDLRKMLYPIGPVVVFGASNFPLAFSTAGGDTISAFAAACPVVVKAHPYHAGTSELVAQAITKAVEKCKLPKGIFSHLGGQSHDIGSKLVSNPLVKGVGFTGSFSGGKALYDLAQQRAEPIPVFAEMGSINPIFILEAKLKSDRSLAEAIAQSVTLGTGQFCTTSSERSLPMQGTCARSSGDLLASIFVMPRMDCAGTIRPSTALRSYCGSLRCRLASVVTVPLVPRSRRSPCSAAGPIRLAKSEKLSRTTLRIFA